MKKSLVFIVLTAAFVYACNKKNTTPNTDITKTKNPIDFSAYAEMGLDSPFISIDTANVMLSSFLNSIQDNSSDVKSFIVDANALRYYLQNTDIKYVKLMLAHKRNYINNGGKDQNAGYKGGAFTVIISGFGADNNYIYSPQGAVLDFSQPCPYNCVSYGTASADTLPAW